MRHIKNVRAGEFISDKGGNKAKVLFKNPFLLIRSEWFRYDVAAQHFVTVEEAQSLGWKILTKDGREEVSKKELERLMPNVKITR